jgi:hypothetical protein
MADQKKVVFFACSRVFFLIKQYFYRREKLNSLKILGFCARIKASAGCMLYMSGLDSMSFLANKYISNICFSLCNKLATLPPTPPFLSIDDFFVRRTEDIRLFFH